MSAFIEDEETKIDGGEAQKAQLNKLEWIFNVTLLTEVLNIDVFLKFQS